MINESNLVWLDLEMTGLDPQKDHILQIATVITDKDLTILQEGRELVIHQPMENLQNINSTVQKMHTSSGLLNRVAESTMSLSFAEQEIIGYLTRYAISGIAVLCGNSIGVDRSFLKLQMPQLESFFHYRMVDVSSLKELVRRWYPTHQEFKKEKRHTALADVYESIAELRYYRDHYFKAVKE